MLLDSISNLQKIDQSQETIVIFRKKKRDVADRDEITKALFFFE